MLKRMFGDSYLINHILLCMIFVISACTPIELTSNSAPATPNQNTTKSPEKPVQDVTPGADAPDCSSVAIANPASSYCGLLGYEHRIEDTEIGQAGMCYFPDGTSCDEWAFLTGKCGQEFSWCAQQEYQIETISDGKDPFSQEYAVCLDEEGNQIGSVTDLSGLAQMMDLCQ